MTTDPRSPCLVGVATRTWRKEEVGDAGAPEPLAMWEEVARAAAEDSGAGSAVLDRLDAIDVVYTQTWQYDDTAQRLADRLGADPKRKYYSGIGGTTPQLLVQNLAAQIVRSDLDVALVVGAEALATQKAFKKKGERYPYSFKPEAKRSFPWEAPFHPAEVAHEVFQAWLTFAIFDNARRAHLGVGLDEYRAQLGEQWERFTKVAAANPEAWFRIERSAEEIITPTATNRMVGYPYTKYMVSIMDVDMAGALLLTSHEAADAMGVPQDRRVYLRGWSYATDPIYVAEHVDLWKSPALEYAASTALAGAGAGVDDVAHLDLYSCFASSVNFARDALGIAADDSRPLTVTGGLPYHGGAGSDYLTHSIATMARVLRDDPGSFGMVSGVGMHMTKHIYGVYSTDPGRAAPTPPGPAPEQPAVTIHDIYEGPATVAAYSVVHGRDGEPEWGVAVCDVGDGGRAYAKMVAPDLLASAEEEELVGRTLALTTHENVNTATL
jgi:acetyl-CoA C-acetyltransferase